MILNRSQELKTDKFNGDLSNGEIMDEKEDLTSPVSNGKETAKDGKDQKHGIDPNFVFLQLFHSASVSQNGENAYYIPKSSEVSEF